MPIKLFDNLWQILMLLIHIIATSRKSSKEVTFNFWKNTEWGWPLFWAWGSKSQSETDPLGMDPEADRWWGGELKTSVSCQVRWDENCMHGIWHALSSSQLCTFQYICRLKRKTYEDSVFLHTFQWIWVEVATTSEKLGGITSPPLISTAAK